MIIPITGTVTIPDAPQPFDPTDLANRLSALEARVLTIENTPVPTPVPTPTPTPTPVRIFSQGSVWHKKLVPNAPIHPKSQAYIARLTWWLRNTNAWVNRDGKGVPVFYTTSADPKKPVFDVDPGHVNAANNLEIQQGINLPAGLMSSGGTDGHATIYNKSTDTLYDFWKLKLNGSRWECRAVGILKLASISDGTFPKFSYWNTATASHLPLVAGLLSKDGLAKGIIESALRFATPKAAKTSWVYPAKSTDQESFSNTDYDTNALPMGLRLRLPANTVINPAWTPLTKVIVAAVRDYGMILSDTTMGSATVFITEDSTKDGIPDILKPYLGGKNIWDVVGAKAKDGEFPWSQLVAVA